MNWKNPYTNQLWFNLRKAHLAKEPWCIVCKRTFNLQVDHIFDHKTNWEKFLDPLNLQTLCLEHHSSKTSNDINISNLKEGDYILVVDNTKDNDYHQYEAIAKNNESWKNKLFLQKIEISPYNIYVKVKGLSLGEIKHILAIVIWHIKARPNSIQYIDIDEKLARYIDMWLILGNSG